MGDHGEPRYRQVKYILVTGGLVNGIGKNVVAASIGMILKASGFHVTAIKINPSFNVDAENINLYTHGEVFVLDDGGHVDMDVGIFERFLGVNLHSRNWITSGKIYENVLKKEKEGSYNGETIKLTQQVTSEITGWIQDASILSPSGDARVPDVCVIELGGIIEDTEAKLYLEAFKKLHLEITYDNLCCVHVGWIPQPNMTSDTQVKAIEMSVRELQQWGLSPDVIICRSESAVPRDPLMKIADACLVPVDRVISLPILPSLYHIPIHLKSYHLSKYFCERLGLSVPSPRPQQLMTKWRSLLASSEQQNKSICIAVVGKYTKVENCYASLRVALEHAALACQCKLNIEWIYAEDLEPAKRDIEPSLFFKAWDRACKADGILVPGGYGPRGIEGKIDVIRWAREFRKPFLGIGLGFHCAVIEYARNVLGWKDANTSEVLKSSSKNVVIAMPEMEDESKVCAMKAGRKQSLFSGPKSILQSLYGNKAMIEERHCHRYDVNPKFVTELQNAGLRFCASDVGGIRMDALELPDMKYFAAVQFHPEYSSRPLKPAPPILGLVMAACGQLDDYLHHSMALPAHYISDEECGSDEETLSLNTFGEGDIKSEFEDSTFTPTSIVWQKS